MSRVFGQFSRERATGKLQPIGPLFTLPSGCTENYQSNDPCFYGLGPYDFATIYNVLPLWNAGINGTGQTIAIVGETNINIQDVRDFRSLFGLPSNDPQIILNVNFPVTDFKGVKITRLGKRIYGEGVIERLDPRGRKYYWIGGEEPTWYPGENTDFEAVQNGYVSITPLHLDLTHHASIARLKPLEEKLAHVAKAR